MRAFKVLPTRKSALSINNAQMTLLFLLFMTLLFPSRMPVLVGRCFGTQHPRAVARAVGPAPRTGHALSAGGVAGGGGARAEGGGWSEGLSLSDAGRVWDAGWSCGWGLECMQASGAPCRAAALPPPGTGLPPF
jgi:hypothetical protein